MSLPLSSSSAPGLFLPAGLRQCDADLTGRARPTWHSIVLGSALRQLPVEGCLSLSYLARKQGLELRCLRGEGSQRGSWWYLAHETAIAAGGGMAGAAAATAVVTAMVDRSLKLCYVRYFSSSLARQESKQRVASSPSAPRNGSSFPARFPAAGCSLGSTSSRSTSVLLFKDLFSH